MLPFGIWPEPDLQFFESNTMIVAPEVKSKLSPRARIFEPVAVGS
jgi:hypothetical protein